MEIPTTTASQERLTIMLDPSAIKESACILRLYRMVVLGLTHGVNSSDIEFGSAFHSYRKRYVELQFEGNYTDNPDLLHFLAMKEAYAYWNGTKMFVKKDKDYLNKTYLEQTCEGYQSHYAKHGTEYEIATIAGKPLLELRLSYPYYVAPEGDIEVILCGTVDKVVRHRKFGFYAIADYKTTAVWNKQKFFEGYRMSTQMVAYKYILKKMGELYPNSELSKMTEFNMPAVIDGIFHGKSKPAEFEMSEPLWYSEDMMEEFEFGLQRIVGRLVEAIRDNRKLFREGMLNAGCEKIYGACNYFNACSAPNKEEEMLIINNKFVRRPYSPLTHGELKNEKGEVIK